MSVLFQSNLGAFFNATERAQKAGLIAAGELFVTDMKAALEHGYTTGAFVTGANVNAVARGEPEVSGDGASIAVGSTLTDPDYPTMWELGHQNTFTGRYERVEKWVPTMVQNRDKYVAAFVEEMRAVDRGL